MIIQIDLYRKHFIFCGKCKTGYQNMKSSPFCCYVLVTFDNLLCAEIIDKLFQKIHPWKSNDSAADDNEEKKWRGCDRFSFMF